jgi:tetratricopeptide (TPR) repeat protein
VHWAHRVRDRFPDGQLYVNLRGFDPSGNAATTEDVIRGFLTAFDVPGPGIPAGAEARSSLYRSLLADKRVLVVLDNAADAEQVRPLLPGAPGCLTLVTSRNQLPSLIAAEGAAPVVLDLLSPDEARDALARRVGAARVEAEPDAATEIVDLCVRLPLALAIVAARAVTNPSFPLASLADELREARGDLSVFDAGDPAASVRAVFSWSYRTLTDPAAQLFRLLGGHPGPHVAPIVAASILGVPVRLARTALAELARAQLIVETRPGHFGFHDLLRAYAQELSHDLDPEPVLRAALHRTLDHYLHSAAQADRILRPQKITPIELAPVQPGVTVGEVRTQQAAAEWFAAEHTVLHTAVEQAARHGFDAHAWQLTHTITATSRRLGELRVYETALAAARRLGEPLALALSHRALAVRHLAHGQLDDAEAELTASLALMEEIGDIGLLADLHQGLGAVAAMTGRHTQQREHTERALELFRTAGNQNGVATSYSNLAWCFAQLEDYERAFTLCKQSLEILEDFPDRGTEANTWDTLGFANLRLGQPDEAIACYQRAIELDRKLNSRAHESDVHRHIGDIHHDRGDVAQARAEWQQALEIVEELRLTARADELRERLARLAD